MLSAYLTKLTINLNIILIPTPYLHFSNSLKESSFYFFILLLVCLNWQPNKVHTLHIVVAAQKTLLFYNYSSSFFCLVALLVKPDHLSCGTYYILWIWQTVFLVVLFILLLYSLYFLQTGD